MHTLSVSCKAGQDVHDCYLLIQRPLESLAMSNVDSKSLPVEMRASHSDIQVILCNWNLVLQKHYRSYLGARGDVLMFLGCAVSQAKGLTLRAVIRGCGQDEEGDLGGFLEVS